MKNFKVILTLGVLLCCSQVMRAGDGEKLGFRVGYQNAGIRSNGDKLAGASSLSGFYAGVFKDHKLVPLLSLGTGVEYLQNGYSASVDLMGVSTDYKYIYHTIGVPIYAKAKVGPIYGLAGISPNFIIGESLVVNDEKTDSDSEPNWFDAPVFVGAGFKFLMLSVEARYHWGLIDIYDSGSMRNQYLQIGATLSF